MKERIAESLGAVHTCILKNKKGAITLYVAIACIFILIVRNSRICKNK